MPIIIQELQSIQFGVVARGGRDRLSFYLALLLILYSPSSFLVILLASNGVPSFVSFVIISKVVIFGPALSTRGNLARTRARGAGSPRTVEHCYLPSLGFYKTLMMMAKE